MDQQAVHRTDDRADHERVDDGHPDPRVVPGHGGRDDEVDERDHRRHRQVDAADQHHQRLADGDDPEHRGEHEQCAELAHVGVARGDPDGDAVDGRRQQIGQPAAPVRQHVHRTRPRRTVEAGGAGSDVTVAVDGAVADSACSRVRSASPTVMSSRRSSGLG